MWANISCFMNEVIQLDYDVKLAIYAFFWQVSSLKVLLNALHPVRASWYNIGLELDIPHATLDCFEENHSDQIDLLREVLKYWFKTAVDPRPSWEAVVAALRSCIVNEWFVAAQLESEYCAPVWHKTYESNSLTKLEKSEGSYHYSIVECSQLQVERQGIPFMSKVSISECALYIIFYRDS